ncbi:MAG: hypothetical protein IKI62_06740 [Clostridia bacterium]|nr:hypothetical protein [Clostridia bacterium]
MKKELVLIGAGKIGRGYMTYIADNAGYRIHYLDAYDPLVKGLREQGYYTMFVNSFENGKRDWTKRKITNFDIFCTQTEYEQCLEVLATANLATAQIYAGAIEPIGKMVADAIKLRVKRGFNEPLDIAFVVNFLYGEDMCKEVCMKNLDTQEEKDYAEKYVGFVAGLVKGYGPTPSEAMLKEDPFAISCSDADSLPVDVLQMKGELPTDINFVPAHYVTNLEKYKIWAGNVSHCAIAFFGKQRGYEKKVDADLDPYVYKCQLMCARESFTSLKKEVKVLDEELHEHLPHLGPQSERGFDPDRVNREDPDTLNRIGADPIRKLGRNDRIVGPALVAIKGGEMPFFLARAAAMGFYFINPNDKSACELQEYIKENGIEKAIEKYCELDLNDKAEYNLYQLILGHYIEISSNDAVGYDYFRMK